MSSTRTYTASLSSLPSSSSKNFFNESFFFFFKAASQSGYSHVLKPHPEPAFSLLESHHGAFILLLGPMGPKCRPNREERDQASGLLPLPAEPLLSSR